MGRNALTGSVVLLQYVLNVVDDEFPRCRLEIALANFDVLQRHILADERQRNWPVSKIAHQACKRLIDLAVRPVVADAIGVAVSARQAPRVAVAVIVVFANIPGDRA
ncbi:Uncharacterised protein [Raoultella terrigena]|uniref:Uncharacterized protein n=1 Tax=Raoultella terrigena TaxID=577 RepID=A0A3P8JCK1_RAOTE|nr:Uncharacterised protein [Raoultella terrigena]